MCTIVTKKSYIFSERTFYIYLYFEKKNVSTSSVSETIIKIDLFFSNYIHFLVRENILKYFCFPIQSYRYI